MAYSSDQLPNGLEENTTLADADELVAGDASDSNRVKKITLTNLLTQLWAYTATLTNKTINGANNTISNLTTAMLASPTGSDTNVVTGTAGTSGDLAQWNVDGDIVDGPTPPTGAIVGTTDTQTLTNKTLSDATNTYRAASDTVDGAVELATIAETDTGTDATRAVTPDGLQGSKRNIRWLVFNLVEKGTDCAVDTNIGGDFVSPIAGTILQSDTTPFYLYATNSTAGTTGTMVVDISIGGTSIMTTNKLDFDTTEKTTTTAATPPDLTTTSLAVGDIITIDIDSIHTTAAKGLTVYMAVRES